MCFILSLPLSYRTYKLTLMASAQPVSILLEAAIVSTMICAFPIMILYPNRFNLISND